MNHKKNEMRKGQHIFYFAKKSTKCLTCRNNSFDFEQQNNNSLKAMMKEKERKSAMKEKMKIICK